MPEGLEQQIDVDGMTHLLEFLTSKGKYVPLPLGEAATAVSDRPLFSGRPGGADQMIFGSWGTKDFQGIPFHVIDPQNGKQRNVILLNGPQGTLPPKMPRKVTLPCNMVIKNIHLLSGVSGWGYPFGAEGSTTMIVRLRYEDGTQEEHKLLNGVHFADYIRRVEVPQSKFAFSLRNQQLRYLSVQHAKRKPVHSIDLIKGDDASAPMVMAMTAEQFE